MFTLSDEQLIMNSPGNSVQLTTHRIIYESESGKQQMILEDVESYQLKENRVGSYGYSVFVLALAIVAILSSQLSFYSSGHTLRGNYKEMFLRDIPFYILLILVFIFFIALFRWSKRNIISIKWKNGPLDIRVKSFKHPSVQRMPGTMMELSIARKKILARPANDV